jgi:hypothetical protein
MSPVARYRTEEVARTPRGWRVRTRVRGSHVLRIAFPPGPRRKGAGEVVQILHPKTENPQCKISKNPGELLIFGNPSTKRATRERAAKIRAARLNPGERARFDAMLDPQAKKMFGKSYESLSDGDKRKVWHLVWKRFMRREKKRPNPKCGMRNPDETKEAVRLFESFHGREAREIAEKQVSDTMRKDYAALGDLIALGIGQSSRDGKALVNKWDKENHIKFQGDGVKLASAPNGKQLYLIGGTQNIDRSFPWDKTDVDKEKDFIDLGECPFVVYLARKVHGNFEPVEYLHEFGEKNGLKPRLMYDKLKKQIFFVGGEYFIDTKQGVSPGIEN